MPVHIVHETLYEYDAPVHAIAMEARLQPCADNLQNCLRYRLTVSPKAAINEYVTFSDVTVHHWTILKANEVHIVSDAVVEMRERSLLPIEAPPASINIVEQFPFIQPTPLTDVTPQIREYAEQFAKLASEDWYQAALAIRESVYALVDYQPNKTTTTTTAHDVLNLRCGVCQDFTHLMIATLRALAIPVRYTSGYLNPQVIQPTMAQLMTENAMVQQIYGEPRPVRGATASHAWCEVYMGAGVGWRGFCPTNNLLADHHFVRIGAGRDYNDLTPLKGVHRGAADEKMTVHVTINTVEET